jgi:hypothetical protein
MGLRYNVGLQDYFTHIQLSVLLEGHTPTEQITDKTPNISEYLDLGCYDWVWFKENAGLGKNKIRRWLGVVHQFGNLM